MAGVLEIAQKIETYFATDKFWEYERTLGHGSFGLVVLLSQKGRGSAGFRMVVKVALQYGKNELREEIDWLEKVNGAMHIARLIASSDPDFPNLNNNRFPPMSWVFDTLAGIQGPIVAMEYIDGGNLLALFYRMEEAGVHMPNRILWSIFLCMIRACIGMAYPIGAPLTSTTSTLETIPSRTPPGPLKHNDIALRNMMVGTAVEEGEHKIGTVFKLIDFGMAHRADPASPDNLFAIAEVLASFITMKTYPIKNKEAMYQGSRTRGGYLLLTPQGIPFPWLDPALAGLMAQCLYILPDRRPSLQEALARASYAVLRKPSNMYPNPQEETDEVIKNFVQNYILNASPGN
ncbi:kinase-like domain-containing protein [Xylaria sp. FL1777]|nr:kinase-like domain-containing protein [Xylaria sp. FL1777]